MAYETALPSRYDDLVAAGSPSDAEALRGMGLFPAWFSAPIALIWELTGRCHLRCQFCFGPFPKQSQNELSRAEKLALARELIDARIYAINLTGGEPTLCEELPELVRLFTGAGIPACVATSGWGMTPELARELGANRNVGIFVSIDSPVEADHDRIRGREGAYRAGLAAVEMLQRTGRRDYTLAVESVINRQTLHQMPEMVRLCREMGVRYLSFQPAVMVGRGAEEDRLSLSEADLAQMRQVVDQHDAALQAAGPTGPDEVRMVVRMVDQAGHIRHGLETGRNWGGVIGHDGTVRLSTYLRYTFGNIRTAGGFMPLWRAGFRNAWRHPALRQDLTEIRTIKDLERAAARRGYRDCALDLSEMHIESEG